MFRTALFCLLVAGLFSSAAHAQSGEQFSFSATLKYGAYYTPNSWTAITLDMINPSDRDIDGYVQFPQPASAAIPSGPADVRHRIIVPARSKVKATIYGFFPDVDPPATKKGESPKAAPELTIVTWRSADGSQLSRCPVLGQSNFRKLSKSGEAPSPLGAGCMLISSGRDDYPDVADATGLSEQLNRYLDYVAAYDQKPVSYFPRHMAGYAPFRMIVLDHINPEDLDAAQRQTLLNHVQAGAQLVIPQPSLASGLAESWLAPYLPVQLVGERKLKQLGGKGQPPLPLTGWCDATEAIFRDGTVVLGDDQFVHAAWRPLGLGRVIFTSFPANALDLKQPAAQQLWRSLLSPSFPPFEIIETKLLEQQEPILRQIVGLKTPPWKTAAMLASGYLVLVGLVQLIWRGPTRPRAFGVLAIAAVIYSAGLVSLNVFARRSQPLMQATMGLVDVANGGGRQLQYSAFFGQDQDDLTLDLAEPQATIRPLSSSQEARPTLEQSPWRIPNAGVAEQRIDRVWEAVGPAPEGLSADASVRFSDKGASLQIKHSSKQPLDSGLVLWGDDVVRLPRLAADASDVPLTESMVNPVVDDFTNSAVLTSEGARVRGIFVGSLYSRGVNQTNVRVPYERPQLVAWVSSGDVASLFLPSIAPGDVRRDTLLRVPLTIEPAAPNSTVRIDPPFVSMLTTNDLGGGRYNAISIASGPWSDSNQPGYFHFGFYAPRQLGRTKPTRFQIQTEIHATSYNITLRRGQIVKGKPKNNPAGPAVAEYKTQFGLQDAKSFDVTDEDVDSDGIVWILMTVEQAGAVTPGQPPGKWSLRKFRVQLDAQVLPQSDQ